MKRSLLLSALLLVTAPIASAQTITVTTSSDDARAHFEQARDRMHHVDADGVREHLQAAIAADPSFALAHMYLALWSPPSEREALLAKAQAAPASDGERQMIESAVRFEADDDEGGLALLSEIAEAYADDPWPAHHLANTHYSAQRNDEAADAFRMAIAADADFAGAYNMLGYAEMRRGNDAAAEQAFRDYLRVAPEEANAHDSIGEFYMRRGRLDEAKQHFEQALAIDPELTASRRNLVQIEIMVRGDDFEDAVRRQDASAVAALHTGTARLAPPNREAVIGRNDIRDYFAASFESGFESVEMETMAVYPGEDLVTETGTMTFSQNGQVVDEGKYTIVWVHNGDTWVIHRAIWNSDRPPPAVASSN